jgi:hypothetical protein
MNYEKIYNDLMTDRIKLKFHRLELKKTNKQYYEHHHIKPKCMGGDKSYSVHSDNIVLLTAREHYIAHRLLWLIHKTRELALAFHKMVYSANNTQERIFDSYSYAAAKEAFSLSQSGKNNPMYGKSANKGKPSKNKGKILGPRPYMKGDNNPAKKHEVREKISEKLKGVKKSPINENTRKKLSIANSGVNNPMYGQYKDHFLRPVYEYDKITGNLKKKWDTLIQVSQESNLNRKSIYGVIKNKTYIAFNSIWLFDDNGDTIDVSLFKTPWVKQINQITKDGDITKTFNSMSDLASYLSLSNGSISSIVKNKKERGGFYYVYANNE